MAKQIFAPFLLLLAARPRKRDLTFSALEQTILAQVVNPHFQALA
jgi:hypothetical protein